MIWLLALILSTEASRLSPCRHSLPMIQDGYGTSGPTCLNPVTYYNMTLYKGWPSNLTLGSYSFQGGVFDGRNNVWLVPSTADGVIKIDRSSGAMTNFNSWPVGLTRGGYAFQGAVFDGTGYLLEQQMLL